MSPELVSMLGRSDNSLVYWENDQTNFREAIELSGEFLHKYRPRQVLAGLSAAGCARSLGYPDVHDENGLRKIYINDVREFAKGNTRAKEYFEKILK